MRAPLLVLVTLTGVVLTGCTGGGTATRTGPSTTGTPAPSAIGPDDPLSPAPPVESTAPPPTGPTCSSADLTVADADLLADERQLQEVFAMRTRGRPCRLSGWPAVSLLGADDAPIRVTSRRTGRSTALSLTRDTSLSFVLSTPRTSDCQDVAAVVVTLPGTTRPIRTGTTMQVCHHELGIGPVERRGDDE